MSPVIFPGLEFVVVQWKCFCVFWFWPWWRWGYWIKQTSTLISSVALGRAIDLKQNSEVFAPPKLSRTFLGTKSAMTLKMWPFSCTAVKPSAHQSMSSKIAIDALIFQRKYYLVKVNWCSLARSYCSVTAAKQWLIFHNCCKVLQCLAYYSLSHWHQMPNHTSVPEKLSHIGTDALLFSHAHWSFDFRVEKKLEMLFPTMKVEVAACSVSLEDEWPNSAFLQVFLGIPAPPGSQRGLL